MKVILGQPVIAQQDDAGHWYLVPNELKKEFIELNNKPDADDNYELFEAKFGQYRTGGDLNIVQLYIESNP